MDRPWGYYVKENKSEKTNTIRSHTYIWNRKKLQKEGLGWRLPQVGGKG